MKAVRMDESTRGEGGCLIPGLPNEISLRCLALVPLLDRPNICAVCRNWRSIYHQKIFWDVRDGLLASEEMLFLGLWSNLGRVRWYGLYLSTGQWFKLPPMRDEGTRHEGSRNFSLVCFDKKLFVIEGPSSHQHMNIGKKSCAARSPAVSYFDLKIWQWKSAAPLNIARAHFRTRIVNNELYVCGEIPESGSRKPPAEVYDLSTQTWRLVADTNSSTRPAAYDFGMDEKFYVTDCMSFAEFRKTSSVYWTVYDPPRDDGLEQRPTGIYYDWCQRPVELNGKWYMKCETNINGKQTFILLYDPMEDVWEDFVRFCSRGMLENTPKRVVCRWPIFNMTGKLMAIGGRLCIVQENRCFCGWGDISIKDLTGRCIFSRSFDVDPTGINHRLLLMAGLMIEQCEVVTL